MGKTTAVRRAAELLADVRIAGFYTAEVRDAEGRRRGFEAVSFGGGRATISDVSIRGTDRVGRYGVDVAAVDRLAQVTLRVRAGVDLFLVDEIGRMECCSRRFVEAFEELAESGVLMIATVALRGSGLIGAIKRHPAAEVWEVTPPNRDALPERLAHWVRQRIPS